MEFTSYCGKWEVLCSAANPEEFATVLIQACKRRLPPEALGHIKAIVEFSGGSIFASSTIIPPEITVQVQGSYGGGGMMVHGALIFMGLSGALLKDVLSLSILEAGQSMGCTIKEIKEES